MELKALVDKENNRVIFAECDEDFVDILFSFLTMPMGTIIRLTGNRPPTTPIGCMKIKFGKAANLRTPEGCTNNVCGSVENLTTPIGCMNNLHGSVENLEAKRFRTENCKTMLLHPQNGAAVQWKSLKLRIDEEFLAPPTYFTCRNQYCTLSKHKLLSYYQNVTCNCGEEMDSAIMNLIDYSALDGGVFVKGLTRLIITDELLVMPASTTVGLDLFSKLEVTDASAIEERTFPIGADEVRNLLKHSLLSKRPLTETLLQNKLSSNRVKQRRF